MFKEGTLHHYRLIEKLLNKEKYKISNFYEWNNSKTATLSALHSIEFHRKFKL